MRAPLFSAVSLILVITGTWAETDVSTQSPIAVQALLGLVPNNIRLLFDNYNSISAQGAIEDFKALGCAIGFANACTEPAEVHADVGEIREKHKQIIKQLESSSAPPLSSPPLSSSRRLSSPLLSSLECSGLGIPLAASTTSLQCNGQPVSQALYDAITTAQAPGATPATLAALAVALAASNGSAVDLIGGERPVDSLFNLTDLSPLQQLALTTALNVSDVSQIQNVSQLIPVGANAPARTAVVITALGASNVATLLNGTQCSSTSSIVEKCICPYDRYGDSCQFARHFTCAAVLAEPEYHLCAATNGFGFVVPQAGRPANATMGGLGAGSGVAVPGSYSALMGASSYLGITRVRDGGSWRNQPPPQDVKNAANHYRALAHGIPPCIYMHRGNAAPIVNGNNGLVPFSYRISCEFAQRNATISLASGEVLMDPEGLSYFRRLSLPKSTVAGVVARSTSLREAAPPSVTRCNGTNLTPANLASLLQANNLTQADGEPPYYGLECLESKFQYVAGGSARFALSSAPNIPIALRLHAISHKFLSDVSGVSTTPVPLSALNGSADVTVWLNVSKFAKDADIWASGRMYVEAKVVMLPDGWQANGHASPSMREAPNATLVEYGYSEPFYVSASSLSTILNGSTPQSILILSNIHAFAVDDSAYTVPTVKSLLDVLLGVLLGLALPILLVAGGGITWYKRKAKQRAELEREAIQDRMMAQEAHDREAAVANPAAFASASGTTRHNRVGRRAFAGDDVDTPGLELVDLNHQHQHIR